MKKDGGHELATPARRRVDKPNILPAEIATQTEPQPAALTYERIARRAYDLYLMRGCEPGHDAEDWSQAEHELRGSEALALRPADGDIVIRQQHRNGAVVFVLHTAPGPDQYRGSFPRKGYRGSTKTRAIGEGFLTVWAAVAFLVAGVGMALVMVARRPVRGDELAEVSRQWIAEHSE